MRIIDLKGMQADSCKYEFVLDNLFFANIDGPEVQKGKVNVTLVVKKTSRAFELNFQTDGMVWVPCDRCLDDMEQPVSSTDKLMVKFGHEYAEEGDNLIVIPEEEGEINVAWFMYEFIALAIPMKHVHAPGKCNKAVSSKLHKHLRTKADEDDAEDEIFIEGEDALPGGDVEETQIDPRRNELKKIIDNFPRPFKLEKEPLIRVELHYIDNRKTLLLVDSHHIIMDGTSLNNLIIEFERLYNGENLKRIPIQYKDYAVWENKFNESESIKEYEKYWINKFKDAELSQLNLPYDYKISTNRSYAGKKISNVIDKRKFRKIERYAKKIGASPYMLFISAFFILLYKYTGQEEIKRVIGMFANNIVVKANMNSELTFQEFLDSMKEQILDDISNQPYPFDMLVKKLGIKVDNSRNPLFDVMFTYQNKEENILKLDD